MKTLLLPGLISVVLYSLNSKPILNKKIDFKIGITVKGDFNGNGKIETAMVKRIKIGRGNPVENGTADEYELRFSDDGIKPMQIGCCGATLINEGDLNHDGADEISIYQQPMNGCTNSMTTYGFKTKKAVVMVPRFLIPTGCEELNYQQLQQRVFEENKYIYYLATDPNAVDGKLIKIKVKNKFTS